MRRSLVAVTCTLALAVAAGRVRAATYTFTTLYESNTGTISSSGADLSPIDINDNGQILTSDATGRTFVSNAAGGLINIESILPLPALPVQDKYYFNGFNDNGQFTGNFQNGIGGNPSYTFVATKDNFIVIPPPTYVNVNAFEANDGL